MHWAKIYDMPNISLRFFNAYGPNSRTTGAYGAMFGVFLAQKLNNKPLQLWEMENKQEILYMFLTLLKL